MLGKKPVAQFRKKQAWKEDPKELLPIGPTPTKLHAREVITNLCLFLFNSYLMYTSFLINKYQENKAVTFEIKGWNERIRRSYTISKNEGLEDI